MKHELFIISPAWGNSEGGINVFNQSLVLALSNVLGPDIKINVFVKSIQGLNPVLIEGLDIIELGDSFTNLKNFIENKSRENGSHPIIIGHDVHTGREAIETCKELRAAGTLCKSGLICHMDYSAYQRFKGLSIKGARERAVTQRELISSADKVFAVGPLLTSSFNSLKGGDVIEIDPGFPTQLKTHHERNPSAALKFYFSGRVTPEDDKLKNGRLALKAIEKIYQNNRLSNDSIWTQRGTFNVFGFEAGVQDREWFFEGVDKTSLGAKVTVNLEEYSSQEDIFDQLKDSHIALMPSMHEGFGLAGWEAICAGIPLVCTDQSGLEGLLSKIEKDDHDFVRESVVSVSLAGTESDTEELADAISSLTNNIDRKRKHAERLSKYLEKHFTWEDAATKVASAFGLAPSGSLNWESREYRARVANESGDRGEILNQARSLSSSGQVFIEWATICTALNFLSDLGKSPLLVSVNEARSNLQQISDGIEKQYLKEGSGLISLRTSGRFELLWRFMAAASQVAESFKEFCEIIPNGAAVEISSDKFLLKEYFYYALRFGQEFEESATEIAKTSFSDMLGKMTNDKSIQIRLARLSSVQVNLETVLPKSILTSAKYLSEKAKCATVLDPTFELPDLNKGSLSIAPVLLALSTLDPKMKSRGLDKVFLHWAEHGLAVPSTPWRGDKLFRAAVICTTVPAQLLLDLLLHLAVDEEEAVRWASIDLAFSPSVRNRLYEASRHGKLDMSINEIKSRLGEIVDSAIVKDDYHPWMQREFLQRFQNEHISPFLENIGDRLTVKDFPIARQLIGPTIESVSEWRFTTIHPEAELARQALRKSTKRILLILPPISLDKPVNEVSSTSSPPLGLGMIAGHLLAHGHDVLLADCHREPTLVQKVIDCSENFDWVGLNVVLSTLRTAFKLMTKIKRVQNAPAIVVGGPAVNTRSFSNGGVTTEEKKSWDFEIFNNAEENFSKLVADPTYLRGAVPNGVEINNLSEFILNAGHERTSQRAGYLSDWPEPILLDRRIFTTQKGRYEPQRTRALGGSAVEAHVAMSRGCDWNCSFCTERKDLSGGEKRRPVSSVIVELDSLAREFDNLRIQFIDDNLLPQLATKTTRIQVAEAEEWTDTFLTQLTLIKTKEGGKFGWRGIFRIEDFLSYEKRFPEFSKRLVLSGCTMLAFGIEHGNEKKRFKMKGASVSNPTNDELVHLFDRLNVLGIKTKAYFILGGPKETVKSAMETIDFAISSGVSLAYFALYKQFIPATKALKKDQPSGSDVHQAYSSYAELDVDWDESLLTSSNVMKNGLNLKEHFQNIPYFRKHPPSVQQLTIYDQLSQLGFKFSDLVKYSDHHEENGPSGQLLDRVNFGCQEDFVSTVSLAYIQFYLREEFVTTYRELLRVGY